MKSFVTICVLSLAIGVTTFAIPSVAQEDTATDSVLNTKLPKLGFAIAEASPGEGLVEATIFESDEKVYLRGVTDLNNDDVAHAFVVSYGEIRIEFTEAGAKKVADLTGANIGKRLAVIFDGRVISVPTIRDKITNPAIISGNFTIGEARKIASGIVSPPFHVYLVLIKSDWSNVKDAQDITTEMQRALKDVAVPHSLLDGLPASGPSILFPTEMVSLYTPQHYSDLLAWLKGHDLVINVERFPTAEVTPVCCRGATQARVATQARMPTYTASIIKPPAFLRLPETLVKGNWNRDDRESPAAPKPFVVKRLEFGWHVSETPMSTTSSEKRLHMSRRVEILEEKRGQEPSVSKVLDESEFHCQIRGNHVAVTQAFLNNHETEFRKAAQAMGFLPLIVTVPTRQATPKAIGKPIVRPPDIVETVETRYRTQYPFWPKPSDDRPIPPITTKQPPVKNPHRMRNVKR